MQIRELKESEVTFTLTVEPEHESVRGSFASGEAALDREMEDTILARLDAGDVWAWCCVVVTARWGDFKGSDSLGCCSYEDEDDFRRGPYFDDMKQQALDDLRSRVEHAATQIAALVEE